MSNKLNIPLGSSAMKRRFTLSESYKKWLLGIFVFMILLGFFRVWVTRDLTSNFHTNGIESTLRIIKTPGVTKQIHENLGSKAIISGRSLTFDSALLLSNRELSLHMDESGVIREISIDSRLDDQEKQSLRGSGFIIYESVHKTIISTIDTDVLWEEKLIHPIRALNPWYDGDFHDNAGAAQISNSISISKSGIKIATGYKQEFRYNATVAENTEILALFTVEPGGSVPLLAQPLITNLVISNFINQIVTTGFQLILARDEAGYAYYVTVPAASVNTQDAALLAQELLKPLNLSTLALTMDDGTTVYEVVSDTESFESFIETDSGVSFLTINDESGNSIHIMQTNEFWTVSNRKAALTSVNFDYKSTCNPSAHSYIKPGALLGNILSNEAPFGRSTEIPFLISFSETSISDTSVKLCW